MIRSLELYNKWGDPYTTKDEGVYMVAWEVPQYICESIPEIPRRIYCNYQMIVPLEVALLNLVDRGLAHYVETWDGCFNVRPIRRYESIVEGYLDSGLITKAMEYMSTHSWGGVYRSKPGPESIRQKTQNEPGICAVLYRCRF